MNKSIRACIFDMDGTLVKNHQYHLEAWMKFWEKHKIHVSRQQMLEQFGRKNREILEAILGKTFTDIEAEALAAEKEELYRNLYRPHIRPIDGLYEFLNQLKKRKIKLALATSAPPLNVDFVLDALNLRFYFDCIVDATMVERGKPHPDIFLKAAACAGELPVNCLVFEDANAGIQSAREAGCLVVAMLTTHSRHELNESDAYIHSFAEWPRLFEVFRLG